MASLLVEQYRQILPVLPPGAPYLASGGSSKTIRGTPENYAPTEGVRVLLPVLESGVTLQLDFTFVIAELIGARGGERACDRCSRGVIFSRSTGKNHR